MGAGLALALPSTSRAAPGGEPFIRAFRDWAAATGCTSANMAVTWHGRLMAQDGLGDRGATARVPIWSLSKSITATCVARLADEGRLELDAPIGRLLPDLMPAMRAVTAAQLITHRSGVPGHTPFGQLSQEVRLMLDLRPPHQVTYASIAPSMRRIAPSSPPGTTFSYCNLNYFLLGELIEAASGQTYVEACNQRLLRPAGIMDAGLEPRWGRLLWSTGGWLLSPAEYLAFAETLAPGGAAGPTARAFIGAVPVPGATAYDPFAHYSLGIIYQPGAAGPMLLHNGSWSWQQPEAQPPIAEDMGSQFRRWPNGLGWCATYDGLSLENQPDAYARLTNAIAHLRGAAG